MKVATDTKKRVMVGKAEDIHHGMVEEEIKVMANVIEIMTMVKDTKGKVKEITVKTIEVTEIEIDMAGIIRHLAEKILKDSGGKIKNIAEIMEVGAEKMVAKTMTMEEVNGETEVGEGIMVVQEERK